MLLSLALLTLPQLPLDAPAAVRPAPAELLAAHQIRAGGLQRLALAGTRGGPLEFALLLDGRRREFALAPVSFRAPGFRLIVQGSGGERLDLEPGPVDTYVGFARDGSARAWLSFDGEHLRGSLRDLTSGEQFDLEPVGDAGEHLLWRAADSVAAPGTCALLPAPAGPGTSAPVSSSGSAAPPSSALAGGGSTALAVAELALDADFQYFQANGSSISATRADMELVIAQVNDDHYNDPTETNDPQILHAITAVVVRTTNDDPYSALDGQLLLGEVASAWSGPTFADVPRDHVQLFTGKNIDGSTIGIAWISGMCGNNAQSVVQSKYGGGLTQRTALSSHELGHNWGSPHCSGSDCHVMCPGLGGCSGLGGDFGAFALAQINAGKDARAFCLDDPGPGQGAVAPAIAGVTPSPLGAVQTGGFELIVTGSGFTGVTIARLDGVALTQVPSQFAVQGDAAVRVTPGELSLGPHVLELENAFGSDSIAFDVDYNAEPTLDLTGQSGAGFLSGDTVRVRVGSKPLDRVYFLASFSNAPSLLPGLVSLDLGNGLTQLVQLGVLLVDPALGYAQIEFPVLGLPPLSTFYVQAAVLSASAPSLPVPVTNLEAGAFLF